MIKFFLLIDIVPIIIYMIASLFISDNGAVLIAIFLTALIASECGDN